MKYVIRFSPDDIAINGKPLQEEVERDIEREMFRLRIQVATLKDGSEKKELSAKLENVEKRSRENAQSKRDVEKDFLDAILAAKVKATAKASDAYEAMDLADRIQNECVDELILDDSERKTLEEAYEKAEKNETWGRWLRAIIKQIGRPQEYKEAEKAQVNSEGHEQTCMG